MSKAKNTQTKSIFKKAGRLLLLLLFVTGISLCATACQTGSAGKLITTTHSITEEFSEISVDCSECTIRLLPSEDGTVKIVCREREKYPHKISVSRGCLSIEEPSRVELFHILSLGQEHPAVTVYLPVDAVSDCALSLESASGDIELSGEFTFVSGEIDCASGDITCASSFHNDVSVSTASGGVLLTGETYGDLDIDVASGNITLENISEAQKVELESASGKIKLDGVSCRSLDAEAASGAISLNDVLASAEIACETASGTIRLERCDAGAYDFESSSGSIKGSLLSEMRFVAESLSGRVSVPNTNGGICKIYTDSGNIEFSIIE